MTTNSGTSLKTVEDFGMTSEPVVAVNRSSSTQLSDFWRDWLMDLVKRSDVIKKNNQSYTVEIADEVKLIPAVVYAAAAVLVLPGLVGNVLLFCLSLRPDVRELSYSVHFRMTSVVHCLCLMISHLLSILQVNDIRHVELLPNAAACKAYGLLIMVITKTPPWVSVAFSIDRYIAVVFPLKRKVYCTVSNARIACAVASLWVFSLEIPIAHQIALTPFQGKLICATNPTEPTFLWSTVHTFVNTVAPCLLLMFLNGHTLFAIKKGTRERVAMSRGIRSHARNGESQAETDQQAVIAKMTRNLLTIPVFTAVTLAPNAVATSYLTLNMRNIASQMSGYSAFMLNVEGYTRILHFTSFSASLYLLIATSKAYRKMLREMLRYSKD